MDRDQLSLDNNHVISLSRLSGDELLIVVTRERRYGPRVNDDDVNIRIRSKSVLKVV